MGTTSRPKPIRIEGDVAYVPLTQGKEAIIDAEDAERVGTKRWHAMMTSDGKRWYARGGSERIYLHRFIVDPDRKDYIDHWNGDGLDNRRSNLRSATNQQNAQNKPFLDPRNKTGMRGVSTHRTAKGELYYVAKISVTRYFPHTDEGLQQAMAEAIELRRKAKDVGLM